jgi:hypothetical protein
MSHPLDPHRSSPRPTSLLATAASCLGLLAGAAAQPALAAAQGLGFAAGANFDELSEIEGDARASFDNATGFHVGVFYDVVLGPLAIRPGIVYVDVGEIDPQGDPGEELDELDLALVEVPVDLRLRLTTPVLTPYLLGGPVVRFNAGDDEILGAEQRDVSVAGSLGVGVEVPVPGLGLRLFPELRYQFGLTGVTDDPVRVGDVVFEPSEDPELNAFMLRVGLTF